MRRFLAALAAAAFTFSSGLAIAAPAFVTAAPAAHLAMLYDGPHAKMLYD